jgi:hypothetical protein
MMNVIDTVERWVQGEEVWPYARCLELWGPEYEMYRRLWDRGSFAVPGGNRSLDDAQRLANRFVERDCFIKKFGFALPCAELLDELAQAETVVEIGAGSGYMTRLMRNRGINVIGSDPRIGYVGGKFALHGCYDDRQVVAHGKTMVRRYPDALVFCSWPSLEETWYRQALKAMRVGQRIVAVMEDSCAEESARDYFDRCFQIERLIDIPAFYMLNDLAYVAIKKRNRTSRSGREHQDT